MDRWYNISRNKNSFGLPLARNLKLGFKKSAIAKLGSRKTIILLFTLFITSSPFVVRGQTENKIDSLRNLLTHSKPNPTEEADLNHQLGNAYRKAEILDSALHYFTKAAGLFFALGDSTKMLKCNNGIAEVYLMQGNNALAAEMLVSIVPIAKALHDNEILSWMYSSLGRTYNQLGDFESGLKYYEEALRWSTEAGLHRLTANAHYGIGMIFYDRGNFPKALEQFESAMEIYVELNNKSAIAICYSAIGSIYYDQGLYSKALQHHMEALSTNKELKNRGAIAANYSNIANVYFIQDDFVKALEFQTESLKTHQEIGNKTGMATNYYNMALIYDRLDQYEEALSAQLNSLALNEENGDQYSAIFNYKNLGDLYAAKSRFPDAFKNYEKAITLSTEVGDQANLARTLISLGTHQKTMHQLTLSRANIEQGLSLAKELGIKDAIRDAFYQLMTLDSLSGFFLPALEHHKMYALYKDSLEAESNHKLTLEIQTRYETEKKDQEIALLNQESEIQKLVINKQRELRNILIGAFLLVAILSFFIYNYYITRQKLKLQVLRNKIASDLHDDVGSTLSSISIFADMAKQQSKEVIPLLDTIGESSTKMLDAMADIVWTINPENDQFEKILLRMRNFAYALLGAKNIDYEFDADEEIQNLKLSMEVRRNLYLIFKEATNNLVKYAEASQAMYSITGSKNQLTMLIRDNGKGFDMEKQTEGNGLKNMRKRAAEIGAQLLIEAFPGKGTQIQLKMAI